MTALAEFYKGKSVFLTGHTGFKGAWLALWLAEMGAEVHGYALAAESLSLFEEAGAAAVLASNTIADVRDPEALARAMAAARPAVVFHLAAQALVRRSYREPRATYETNLMGTVNVLEAVRQTPGVRVCQVITTDKCYDNREWVYPYRESDPLGGADPYSSSKACAEIAVGAYRRSFFPPGEVARHGVSLSSARAGNVIGGGDWAEDRIIPDCVRALERGESILVRNPRAVRPWQFVLEPLAGYLQLARKQWDEPGLYADAYNFGPAFTGNVTVGKIADRVVAGWGGGKWHTTTDRNVGGTGATDKNVGATLHEAGFLKLDITKAVTMLPWRPVYSVDEAVAATVAWYRRRFVERERFSARNVCLEQIGQYEQRLDAVGTT